MAQRVQVQLIDDLDESEASETIYFAVDGSTYEIDLSDANAEKLRDAFAPYVGAARRASSSGPATRKTRNTRPLGRAAAREYDPKEVRAWAREQGIEVNERGRVSAEILEKYRAAH